MKFGRLSDDWEIVSNVTCTDEHLAHNTHKNAMLGMMQLQAENQLN